MTERPFRILFVCTGNTCRSPLAESVARRELKRRGWEGEMEAASAGVAATDGAGASEGSRTVASEVGLDLSGHRARLLTREMAQNADLILGMSAAHVVRARAMTDDAEVALLGDFARGTRSGGASVPDPFGGPVELYRETLGAIEALVSDALDRLPRRLGVAEDR